MTHSRQSTVEIGRATCRHPLPMVAVEATRANAKVPPLAHTAGRWFDIRRWAILGLGHRHPAPFLPAVRAEARLCIRPWPPPLAAIGTLPHQHGPMVRVGGILSNQCLLPARQSLDIVEWLTP